eukprot:CAMPEP_0206150090 /NCGR_PEP_ID=MMETSP1473-20131121/38119_1 /ASSEMBLY_ACC=CAM_ASM_001109 /TAXON_ID=1461547 /ORGANISM="Stichococcus sp, Strain RCC1054" /LENGTH=291 /DNA_ID=CAMNT_0053547579 /DNA_START=419 /DNA_END=1294 /DNA_ORIENTATION=+
MRCWKINENDRLEALNISNPKRHGKAIGVGSHGAVYQDKAYHHENPRAIKVVKLTDANPNAAEEANIHAQLGAHEHVVKYLGHCTKNGQLYIHMERMNGTLAEAIMKENMTDGASIRLYRDGFDPRDVWRVAHALAKALAFLHEQDVVHLDVRLRNVMLSSPGNLRSVIKLGDFGCAKRLGPDSRILGMNGYRPYTAPETLEDAPWSSKASDMWSLGCVLYTLATGDRPFGSFNHDKLNNKIRAGQHTLLTVAKHSQALRDLVEYRLLQLDPAQRATAQEVVEICKPHVPR